MDSSRYDKDVGQVLNDLRDAVIAEHRDRVQRAVAAVEPVLAVLVEARATLDDAERVAAWFSLDDELGVEFDALSVALGTDALMCALSNIYAVAAG